MNTAFTRWSTAFDRWAAPVAALVALLFAVVLLVRSVRGPQRPNRTPRHGLEAGFTVLVALTLLFVVRPIHCLQAMLSASGYAKLAIGTLGQLECMDTAAAWLPCWFAGLTLVGAIGLAASGRTSGRLGRRLRWGCLLGGWAVANLGGLLPLTLAIRRYLHAAHGYFWDRQWEPVVRAKQSVLPAFSGFCWAAAVAVALLGVAVWPRHPALGSSGRGPIRYALAAASWVLSLFVWWMSEPLAGELRHPIPTDYCFVDVGLGFPPPSSLSGIGPDPVLEAPEVYCATEFQVDGIPFGDVEQVEQALRNKRDLWQTLNQGGAFPGIINLGIRPACSMGRLRALLPGLASAGYPSVNVLLTHEIRAHQPFFGPLRGRRWTAVKLRIGTDRSPCDEAAALSFPTLERVAPEVAHWIELRRSSQDICLRLR